MWPSEALATAIYDGANIALIGALVVGVVATVLVVWMGNIKEGYLKREVASAHERAAQAEARAVEANLELAKFKAPRVLSDDEMQSLAREMSPFKGQRVSVGAVPTTFETVSLADQILRALQMAGVNADANLGAAQVQVGIVRGVVARATTGNAKGERFAAAFAKALTDKNVAAVSTGGLLEHIMEVSKQQGRDRNDQGFEWVVIVVGDKP